MEGGFTRDFSCGDMLDHDHNALECRNPEPCKIWQTFNDMRKENKWCDVTLKSGDGKLFPAHQAILAANSSVFLKYLTVSDTPKCYEPSQNVMKINLNQINSDHLQCILDYMYTRELRVNMDNALKLVEYADKFKVNGLAWHSAKFLSKSIDEDNCFMIWQFAKTHRKKKLLQESSNYILKNFIAIAERNRDFLKLSGRTLMGFILNDFLNVKNEESLFDCVIRWVEHDSEARRPQLPTFLSAMRLGLVKMQFLLDNIGNHRYVQMEPSCKEFVTTAVEFLCDLQKNGPSRVSLQHPLVRPRVPTDVLFTFGGWCGSTAICQFETYDTRADRWFNHPTLQEDTPRAYYGLAVVGKSIYIIGGYNGFKYFNTNRKFDPLTKKWTDISPMYTERCYVAVATCHGLIYAMGGRNDQSRLHSVEKYNPVNNQWTKCANMLSQRSDASADTLAGRVYIAGGFDGVQCLSSVEVYHPLTDQWSVCRAMEEPRSGISVIAHNDCLYAIGGFDGNDRLATGERYDPMSCRWTPIKDMYSARSNTAIAIIDDMVFVIGGYNGQSTVEYVECYDVDRDEWLDATDMNLPRSAFKACVISGLPNAREYTYYSHLLQQANHGQAKRSVSAV